MSAAPRVPANADSTRSAHFRSALGSGTAIVGGAVAAVVAFTIGAASHSAAVMIGGPIAVAVLVVVLCWYLADSEAEEDFFDRFAEAHSMVHAARWQLDPLTPLLAGGQRRNCEHWMYGEGLGLGWYTFQVKQEHGNQGDTWTSYPFTLSTVDLGESGMSRFQGIYLRRRRGMFDKLNSDANWLARERLKKVELESSEFGRRYELWADAAQDDLALRQLFSPSFVVWLADHPLQPGFELRAGELVVFVPQHCGEAGRLEWLLMAAREIAKRIRLELTEAAQAGSR